MSNRSMALENLWASRPDRWLIRNLRFHLMGRERISELQARMFHVKH